MSVKADGYTYEEIKQAYQVAANLVALYGDAFLPIFRRMHDEIKKLDEAIEIKTLALNLACANNGIDGKENCQTERHT